MTRRTGCCKVRLRYITVSPPPHHNRVVCKALSDICDRSLDSDILDMDKAELLDMLSSSAEETPDTDLQDSVSRSARPLSAYRRDITA